MPVLQQLLMDQTVMGLCIAAAWTQVRIYGVCLLFGDPHTCTMEPVIATITANVKSARNTATNPSAFLIYGIFIS